jgi:hypothetical protein
MKHKLLTFAGALALLAVLGKFYAVPAIAQAVRAAVVKNIDEKGRIPYQAQINCTGYSVCNVGLSPVPAHSRLVVEHIGLQAVVDTGSQVMFTALGAESGVFNQLSSYDMLLATFQGEAFGYDTYIVSGPALTYFEAGQTPGVIFELSLGITTRITGQISGYLVDLSQ